MIFWKPSVSRGPPCRIKCASMRVEAEQMQLPWNCWTQSLRSNHVRLSFRPLPVAPPSLGLCLFVWKSFIIVYVIMCYCKQYVRVQMLSYSSEEVNNFLIFIWNSQIKVDTKAQCMRRSFPAPKLQEIKL